MGQGSVTPYPLNEIARRMFWGMVQSTLFRWSPRPFYGFRAWLLRLFGAQIARQANVRRGTRYATSRLNSIHEQELMGLSSN